MPNHITTVCTVTGEDARVQAFRKAHITTVHADSVGIASKQQFDFETIIPMPECVKATIIEDWSGEFGDADIELYAKALMANKRTFITENAHLIPKGIKRWGELLEYYDREKPPELGKLA